MVNRIHITVKAETLEIIEQAKKEFLKHHKEMRTIPISYDKIVYEAMKYYLEH